MAKLLAVLLSLYLPLTSCSSDSENILERDQPILVSHSPGAGESVSPSTDKITLTFDRGVVVKELKKITLNDTIPTGSKVVGETVTLNLPYLKENTDYLLTLNKGAIMANVGVTNQDEYLLKFSTSEGDDVNYISSMPEEGSTIVPSEPQIELTFDQRIVIADTTKIELNGEKLVAAPWVDATRLVVPFVSLEESSSYTLTVAAGAIETTYGRPYSGEISISFETTESPIKKELVVNNPTPEVQKVYNFLRDNFGKKTITGTMANVSWNINEAEWVYKHTGKYPALNCFDYIHHYNGWVDYTDTEVVEQWWADNGLVSAMWHWGVPQTAGSTERAFYTESTDFDITKALVEGSDENRIIMEDLEIVASHLLLLKEKNIPVIWRPLHEASGGWFWWGAKDAESCVELWRVMFNLFEEKGLNNLIWVWTDEQDEAWYPGDDYVDIVGVDIYNKTKLSDMVSAFRTLVERHPTKIAALSEFGNTAYLSDQIESGAMWSWVMPWYDFGRTSNPNSGAFNQLQHQHANIAFWKSMLDSERAISREQMPSLK